MSFLQMHSTFSFQNANTVRLLSKILGSNRDTHLYNALEWLCFILTCRKLNEHMTTPIILQL